MDSRLIDLGRRAVVWEGWRWMPGMQVLETDYGFAAARLAWTEQTSEGERLNAATADGAWLRYRLGKNLTPDLADPATLGCLEALALEAYEGRVSMQRAGTWWRVCARDEWDDRCTQSYAEALVCALEAAQEVERG